jgi:serine protease Do
MPTTRSLLLLAAVALALTPSSASAQPANPRRTPIVEVFENRRDTVVNISTTRTVRMRSLSGSLFDDIFQFHRPRQRDRRVQSVGSGVVIHESGYIVTNAHVIAQSSDTRVIFADQESLPASVVAVDGAHDLAVLKVDTPEPLPFQPLGRSRDILIGETVIAIGNPLGYQHTVTSGIVSALNRTLEFGEDAVYTGLIQTDAPINPGNSGGPLLNINGDLIGINTAIRGDAQNIGFAIPVDQLWELIPNLLDIEQRKRVRFGLRVGGPTARVLAVRPDSPAAEAKLRPGDRIVQFNNQNVRDGIDYCVKLLNQQPGDHIHLAVQRGRNRIFVDVPLTPIPPPDGGEFALNLLGLQLEEISPEMRRRYDLPKHVGLIVRGVVRGSAAFRVRILPGDLILRLKGAPVVTLQDVGLNLEPVRPGQTVIVEGLRVDTDRPFFWSAVLKADRNR